MPDRKPKQYPLAIAVWREYGWGFSKGIHDKEAFRKQMLEQHEIDVKTRDIDHSYYRYGFADSEVGTTLKEAKEGQRGAFPVTEVIR